MAGEQTGPSRGISNEVRAAVREMWALGDYNRFATELDSQLGRDLVEGCGIGAGQRVLDVAAGSGNVAIQAAEGGADVVASDITVENMRAGEREASERARSRARVGRGLGSRVSCGRAARGGRGQSIRH